VQAQQEDDDVDPLDAFMAAEVLPEVKAKEEAEKKRVEEERQRRAQELAVGVAWHSDQTMCPGLSP
jgi:hypothetical protein